MTYLAVGQGSFAGKVLSAFQVYLQLTFILFPSHISITLIYPKHFLPPQPSLMKEILSFLCSLVGWVLYF